MRVKMGAVLGAALISLAAVATTAAQAEASPAGGFAAQLRSAGFTAQQTATLQSEIDRDLTVLHGRQVSPNQIVTGDNSVVTYPLPGDKYAHAFGDGLNGNDPRTPFVLCSYGAFCGWKKDNFEGPGFTHATCGDFYEIPNGFKDGGSWINNQTHHYTTSFYGKVGEYLSTSPKAYYKQPHGNWRPVGYISNNC
ncbi:hypothetical protein [Amycolatopsis sp. WGS_07]|uniref:hypothetical protein n=1 Tax=Amycolatopsis sp. WGS_07 TaxID=3076764 RepID=UPI0038730D44